MTSFSRLRLCLLCYLLLYLFFINASYLQAQKTLSLSLKKARKTKKFKATIATRQEPRKPEELVDLLNLSHDALNTSNEGVDPDFDPEESIRSDNSFMIDKFCKEWLAQLSRLDRTSLGHFYPSN